MNSISLMTPSIQRSESLPVGFEFETTVIKLLELRQKAFENKRCTSYNSSVVILGGGPAGLMRAIASLVNGNPTKLLEKREKGYAGRDNIVALRGESIEWLQKYGILAYMTEHRLVYPQSSVLFLNQPIQTLQVRLADLEEAMRAVITRLDPDTLAYSTQVENIEQSDEKISLVAKNALGFQSTLRNIDLLVVAEGARSTTNSNLLANRRLFYLRPVPIIIADFKESLVPNKLLSLQKLVCAIYYHILGIFLVLRKLLGMEDGECIGPVVSLRVPGQYSISTAISRSDTEKMILLKIEAESAMKIFLEVQNDANRQKKEQTKMKLQAFLQNKSWTAAAVSNIEKVIYAFKNHEFKWLQELVPWNASLQTNIVEVTAGKAEKKSIVMGRSLCLIAGDAMAIADPVTGLGCATAIHSTNDFLTALHAMDQKERQPEIAGSQYNESSALLADYMIAVSKRLRALIRPETILDKPVEEFF